MLDTPYMLEMERLSTPRFGGADSSVLPFVDPLPPVPATAVTMLQLELLLQESPVDLKQVSAVILSDAGATLQILRLVGEEFPDVHDRPSRIEDCIASINLDCWYNAIRSHGASPLNLRTVQEWQRCRRIGACARELARDFDGLLPDEAYIVGLLHRLGEFPHLLGWSDLDGSTGEHHALGLMLADFWQLPGYLACALQEQQGQDQQAPSTPLIWRELLDRARQLADPTQEAGSNS